MTSSQFFSAVAMALSFVGLFPPVAGASETAASGLRTTRGPALPCGVDLLGLGQPKQMTLGGQDLTNRAPKAARIFAHGFFRNDQCRHG